MKAVLNAKSGNAGRSSTGSTTLGRTLDDVSVEYVQRKDRQGELLMKFHWGNGETFQVRLEGKDAQEFFKHANWLTQFTPEEPLDPLVARTVKSVSADVDWGKARRARLWKKAKEARRG